MPWLTLLYVLELVFLGDWWSGTTIHLYIDKDDFEKYYGKEHAYCVMNHTYEVDWLIGWMTCDRIHLLGVSLALLKHLFYVLFNTRHFFISAE